MTERTLGDLGQISQSVPEPIHNSRYNECKSQKKASKKSGSWLVNIIFFSYVKKLMRILIRYSSDDMVQTIQGGL